MQPTAQDLKNLWATDPRWQDVTRRHSAEEVAQLQPSIPMEYSFAKHGANRLWDLLHTEDFVNTFGALIII